MPSLNQIEPYTILDLSKYHLMAQHVYWTMELCLLAPLKESDYFIGMSFKRTGIIHQFNGMMPSMVWNPFLFI